jgi:uncharacterized membrane protein
VSKKILAYTVIALASAVSFVLAYPLRYATAYGATGCIRMGEGDAILFTASLMVVGGIGCAAACSLVPRLNRHVWRVVTGSLVAALTFLAGLFCLWLLLQWQG